MNELDAYVEVHSSTPAPKRGVTPVCVSVCAHTHTLLLHLEARMLTNRHAL